MTIDGVLAVLGGEVFILPSWEYTYLEKPQEMSIGLPDGKPAIIDGLFPGIGGRYDSLYDIQLKGTIMTHNVEPFPACLVNISFVFIKTQKREAYKWQPGKQI